VLSGKTHYACANALNRGTCQNKLTIRPDIVEETVLSGLRDNLLHTDLISQHVAEWQREWNRLRREEEIVRSRDATELTTVERQITNLIAAIKQGLFSPSMKSELDSLERRKAEIVATTAAAAEDLPRLHPGLANIYRREVEKLSALLNGDARRDEAANALRSMIEEISTSEG
jgi:site-specific DNA recombinase